MELASFLAGEPWSDRPACTHPLLAALAREVNDRIGDEARQQIAPLVTEVIGLRSDDPRIDAMLAREVALAALPVAAEDRQRTAAVGLLTCERVLNELDGRPLEEVSTRVSEALSDVPLAWEWAREFCDIGFGKAARFGRRSAPVIIRSAVIGIAAPAVGDGEQMLVDLFRRVVSDAKRWTRHDAVAVGAEAWREACDLTVPRSRRERRVPARLH
jgi:hypothetical protein